MRPFHRVAHALLAAAFASTGGSAPFAHVHAPSADHDSADHGGPRATGVSVHGHAAHRHGQGAHWHLPARRLAEARAAAPRVGATPHDHAAIRLPTVAEERLSVRAGAAPALVVVWQADAPRPIERPISVAATARSNPPPRLALGARAPPV